MWTLRLTIVKGDYADVEIWDRLVFTAKAMKRVRCLCVAPGIDTNGKVDLVPEMLRGRRCVARTKIESFDGEDRAAVEFLGYEPAPEDEPSPF